MMENAVKHIEINGRKFCLVRMDAFSAVHYNLRIAEVLKKHGINQVESILSMSSKIFGVLNREDHDEMLFSLLKQSRVQVVENGNFIEDWATVNLNFSPDNVADVYLIALECIKLSVLPVTKGLKKNIGLDLSVTMETAIRQLFSALLASLTNPSEPISSSGE